MFHKHGCRGITADGRGVFANATVANSAAANRMRLTSSAASGGFAATAQPNLRDAVRSTLASRASFANTSFSSRSCSAVFSPEPPMPARPPRATAASAQRARRDRKHDLRSVPSLTMLLAAGTTVARARPPACGRRPDSAADEIRDNTRGNIHPVPKGLIRAENPSICGPRTPANTSTPGDSD